MDIPFARPSIGIEEELAVIKVLRSGWLTTGKESISLEKEFASFVDAKHALAVSSATAGLHLSLLACGVKSGDFVITSTYTFAATAHAISYIGAIPLFVDVEEISLNMDLGEVEWICSNNQGRISAIVVVHFAGLPVDMKVLREIASKWLIPLIEDAAHAFPVKTQLGTIGALGDCGAFSFYATKPMTSGEGGMVVTNSSEAAELIGRLRLHGINRPVWDRYGKVKQKDFKIKDWEYDVTHLGYKYNLSDIVASIARVQLKRSVGFLHRRKQIADQYFKGLSNCSLVLLPQNANEHSWHLFVIRFLSNENSLFRDELANRLAKRGIKTSVHFRPLHTMTYYSNSKFPKTRFPNAVRAFNTALSLPIFPDLTEEEINYIIKYLLVEIKLLSKAK